MALFDQAFNATKNQKTSERWLQRKEFLELIVRLAKMKYCDTKVTK